MRYYPRIVISETYENLLWKSVIFFFHLETQRKSIVSMLDESKIIHYSLLQSFFCSVFDKKNK